LPFNLLIRHRPDLVETLYICPACHTKAEPAEEGNTLLDLIKTQAETYQKQVHGGANPV